MASTPTITAVTYDPEEEHFVVSVTTVDGIQVQLQRSDDLETTWQTVFRGGDLSWTAGAHLYNDYLAPLTGSVTYRARASDDGTTWSAWSDLYAAGATSTGFRLRRPGAPGMTLPLFVPEGTVSLSYVAEKSKRYPRGATVSVTRQSVRRLDRVALPGIVAFSKAERDIILSATNTLRTLQLAADDGSVFWVTVDQTFNADLEDTPGRADQAIWTLSIAFDPAGAPS